MAEPTITDNEKPVSAAVAKSRKLAARIPRLILEARRVASTVIHGLHGRRRAGSARISGSTALHVRRAVAEHRLAALRARRPSLCARARMGSVAHDLDVGRPIVLYGVHVRAFRMEQARPRAGRFVRARGDPRAGRRARRHPGLDAADREPQCHRDDGAADRARHIGTPEPAADFAPAPFSEVLLLSDFWSPVADFRRTLGQLAANGARDMWFRWSIRRKRRSPIRAGRIRRIGRARPA